MKKYAKFYILILLLLSVFVFYGCGSENTEKVSDDDTDKTVSENKDGEKDKGKDGEVKEEPEKETPKEKQPVKETSSSSSAAKSKTDVTGLPEVIDTISSDNGSKLVLVNKLYTVSENYQPTDMVPVDGSLSTNQGLYFKREAYDAYLKMLADAKNEGIDFKICSTYRSYSTQKAIYNGYVSRSGAEYANTISAYPGRSEHHTGWAVDITSASMGYDLKQNFIEYPEGIWINNHCSEYGFIIRYPKDKTHITGYAYEPWHLRYVGVETAKEITSKGLTLEEYLGKY